MKKIFFIVCLFVSAVVTAQPGYTNINNRYAWLAAQFNNGLNIPATTTPALYTGQSVKAGAIIYDSTGGNKGVHVWNGSTWVRMVDTTYTGFGSTNTSIGSGFKIAVDGTNNIKSVTAGSAFTIDSLTAGQVRFRVGGALSGQTDITGNGSPAGSNRFRFNDLGFQVNGLLSLGYIPQINVGVNGTVDIGSGVNNASYNRWNDGWIYSRARDSIQLGVQSDVSGVTPINTYITIYDSVMYFAAGSSQDQYAADSVTWRLTDRSASLTFNSDGWHAWQTLGEYYFYNVNRITDTTGLDILAWSRADGEMVRVPSDIVIGGGGPTTLESGVTPITSPFDGGIAYDSSGFWKESNSLSWDRSGAVLKIRGQSGTDTYFDLYAPNNTTFVRQRVYGGGSYVVSSSGINDYQYYINGSQMATISNSITTFNGNNINMDFQVKGDNDDNMIYGDASADKVGIGTASPSEKLDVSGNVRFSGALMPNNAAGTSGQILQSAGAGAPPTWVSTSTTLTIPINKLIAATAAGSHVTTDASYGQNWQWSGLTNYGLFLSSFGSTPAISTGGKMFRAELTGTNSVSTTVTYAGQFVNLLAGTAQTNIGGYFTALNGTNNYGIIVESGSVGIGTTTPTSMLHVNGSFATAYRALTALRTLDGTDHTIEVTANTFTVTLPTAVGITGRQYVITNSGSGVITLATTSSQTFVNVTATPTTLTLNQFSTVTVVSNGANWLRTSSL